MREAVYGDAGSALAGFLPGIGDIVSAAGAAFFTFVREFSLEVFKKNNEKGSHGVTITYGVGCKSWWFPVPVPWYEVRKNKK